MPVTIKRKRKVLVLGAGASRSVSYANSSRYFSPLDKDFFDLLQRRGAGAQSARIKTAIINVIGRMNLLPSEYWRSMERAFYTLHLREYIAQKLGAKSTDSDERVVKDFAIAINALLRAAHGVKCCEYHENVMHAMDTSSTILSFNYDLVAERALRNNPHARKTRFGRSLYCLDNDRAASIAIIKLHGSCNWQLDSRSANFHVLTKTWSDFDIGPGYRGSEGEGTSFPIFLPFWEKRIERKPWVNIWKAAYSRLLKADDLLVWGYSLPPTDIKAQHLFSLALSQKRRFNLAVIDPAESTRIRWRDLFPKALFWEYQSILDFLNHPPSWWRPPKTPLAATHSTVQD